MPRGSKPGERRGGRKKGTPNKVTAELRQMLKSFCDEAVPKLPEMLEDAWRGIEIEKQMPDGTTVVGRFNADPAKAASLVLSAAEYCLPKLQRIEKSLDQYGDEELLAEVRRRAAEAEKAKEPKP